MQFNQNSKDVHFAYHLPNFCYCDATALLIIVGFNMDIKWTKNIDILL